MQRPAISTLVGVFLLTTGTIGITANLLRASDTVSRQDNTVTLRLHNLKPSEIIGYVTSPGLPPTEKTTDEEIRRQEMYQAETLSGIESLSTDDATGRLIIRGTPEARERIDSLVKIFDVTPKQIRLEARILRYSRRQSNQSLRPEVVATAVLQGNNNEELKAQAYIRGLVFHISARPHVNSDNTTSLIASLTGRLPLAQPTTIVPGLPQRLADSEKRILTGTTASPDKQIQEQVRQGREIPVVTAPPDQTFYLEVTPRLLTRPQAP